MAFPVGVSVAIIEAGRAFTSVGSDVSMSAKVTPIFRAVGGGAMKRIVHAATGHPMLASTEEFKAEAGSVLSFAVPHVDQPGWQAPSGEAYTMWYYAVEITARVGNGRNSTGHVWKQNVQPLVGQDFIDLDLVADGPTGEPVTAPQAHVTDVEGQTGSVVIGPIVGAAIDQAVLEGRIPHPDVTESAPGVYEIGDGGTVYGLTPNGDLPANTIGGLDLRYAPTGALTEVPDADVAALVNDPESVTGAALESKFSSSGVLADANEYTDTAVGNSRLDWEIAHNTINANVAGKADKARAFSADWVNAVEAGVSNAGTSDQGAKIQALLDALPNGGTLYLPNGIYPTKQTLFIPKGRNLVGSNNSRWHYTHPAQCQIRAWAPFTGNAVIKIADNTVRADGVAADGVSIRNITIDESGLPWTDGSGTQTVHGIYCEGLVRSITLENITVNSARGNAFRFSQGASTLSVPRGVEATRLRSVNSCRREHFYIGGTSDSIFTDCLAVSGDDTGFFILNAGETKLVACRAVFTGGHGFWISGATSTNGYVGLQLVAPSTDRCGKHGIYIDSTNLDPITISSPLLRRDGNLSTTELKYAGLCIQAPNGSGLKTSPVMLDSLGMSAGFASDSMTGALLPKVGVRVQNTSMLRVTGMAWGIDVAVEDLGGHGLAPVLPGFRRLGAPASFTDSLA